MLLTNNDWCAPVGPNSRRYFVLEVKNNMAANKAYFDPLYRELYNGGAEAMLDELLQRDITGSNLRFAPETTALVKQREQSLSNIERWTLELARAGAMVSRDGSCHSLHASKSVTIATNHVRDAAKHYCGNDHGFNRALSPLLIELGVTTIRPRVLGKQVPCYEFPPIDEFRANVKKRLRVEIENYADDEDDDEACAVPDIIVTGHQRALTMTAMLQ